MATGQDEIKFSSKAGGSVRSISFMHTERLIPVEETLDDDGEPQPPQTQMQSTESVREEQRMNVTNSQADENTEVCS